MHFTKLKLSLFVVTMTAIVIVGCSYRNSSKSDVSIENTTDTTEFSEHAELYNELISAEIDSIGKTRFKDTHKVIEKDRGSTVLESGYMSDEVNAITLLYIHLEDKYALKETELSIVRNSLSYRTRDDIVLRYGDDCEFQASFEVDFENKVIKYEDDYIAGSYKKPLTDTLKTELKEIFRDDIPFLVNVSYIKTDYDTPNLDISTLGKNLADSDSEFRVGAEVYIDKRNSWYADAKNYSHIVKERLDKYNMDMTLILYVVNTEITESTIVDDVKITGVNSYDTQVLY